MFINITQSTNGSSIEIRNHKDQPISHQCDLTSFYIHLQLVPFINQPPQLPTSPAKKYKKLQVSQHTHQQENVRSHEETHWNRPANFSKRRWFKSSDFGVFYLGYFFCFKKWGHQKYPKPWGRMKVIPESLGCLDLLKDFWKKVPDILKSIFPKPS